MADAGIREIAKHVPAPGTVSVALMLSGLTSPLPVQIEAMSMSGAELFLPKDIVPLVRIDALIEMHVTTPKVPGVVSKITAKVLQVAPRDGDAGCAIVHFANRGDIQRIFPPELVALLNRRRAFRIEPAAGAPVPIELTSPKPIAGWKPGSGTLVDISAIGAAMIIDSETNKTYGLLTSIQASFKLPGAPEAAVVVGTINSQLLVPEGIRLGLVFDGRSTKDWTKYERMITQYITRRQIEKRAGK